MRYRNINTANFGTISTKFSYMLVAKVSVSFLFCEMIVLDLLPGLSTQTELEIRL